MQRRHSVCTLSSELCEQLPHAVSPHHPPAALQALQSTAWCNGHRIGLKHLKHPSHIYLWFRNHLLHLSAQPVGIEARTSIVGMVDMVSCPQALEQGSQPARALVGPSLWDASANIEMWSNVVPTAVPSGRPNRPRLLRSRATDLANWLLGQQVVAHPD